MYGLGVAGLLALLTSCSMPCSGDRQTALSLMERARAEAGVRPREAIKLLSRALEADPTFAEPHRELAMIYLDSRFSDVFDPASALYHLNKYLATVTDPQLREVLSNTIRKCKIELAKEVFDEVDASRLERQLQIERRRVELLLKENERLKQEIQRFQSSMVETALSANTAAFADGRYAGKGGSNRQQSGAQNGTRIHVVKPGDTLSSIARMYKVSVRQLIEANPDINPQRIYPGQRIQIP